MGSGVGGWGMPPAIAKRIERLDRAKPESRLFFFPGAQADLEGAVRHRIERTERQPGELAALATRGGEDQWLVAFDLVARGGQAAFARRQRLLLPLPVTCRLTRNRG